MNKVATADVVIFGGGIAGLWLLDRLRQSGLAVILFESGALGGGQTHKSQGIIHGGMKYALQGMFTQEANLMADMPTIWKACIRGQGEIDLSAVPILSQQQLLWTPNQLTSKLAGFFASKALASKVEPLSKEKYPSIFQHQAFKGEVFSLDEIVIDVPILVRELVKANQDAIFKIEPLWSEGLQFDEMGKLVSATVYCNGMPIEIKAQQFVFAAGSGNEIIINALKQKELEMQRRPLHMVLAKMPFKHALYAHCLGLGARPRLTITTHYTHAGETVWYLGGMLSEEGVARNSKAQIEAAKKELSALFPWLSFSSVEFSTFFIDRAEPKQKNGLKPESSYFKAFQNIVIAWPTKLAFAPKLAADIMAHFNTLSLSPKYLDTRELRTLPIPPLASPIWEEAFCKSVA